MDCSMPFCFESITKNIPITHRDLHYDKDYNLRIYCYFLIMKLGRRLNIRQYALATAHIYLSRFLIKASVREINLYMLVTTCVYLACKVEECPQYIRTLVSEARTLWPEFIPPDPTKVTEFEFYLLEELESYLIVHHPYQSLTAISNNTIVRWSTKLLVLNQRQLYKWRSFALPSSYYRCCMFIHYDFHSWETNQRIIVSICGFWSHQRS